MGFSDVCRQTTIKSEGGKQQVHKTKITKPEKQSTSKGLRWVGVRWSRGGERLLTRLACLFCKQRARSNRKMEAKQRIRAVVRKAETNKKIATIWNAESTGFLRNLHSKEPVTEF